MPLAAAARRPLLFDRRVFVAYHAGRQIRVVTRGLLRAQLLLDGHLADRRVPWLTGRHLPFLSAPLLVRGSTVAVIEVYALDPLAACIEIRVGGKRMETESTVDPL